MEGLRHNLGATDLTALVEVVGAESRPPREGLNVVAYSARVLETFVGAERERLEYLAYLEPDDQPGKTSRQRLIVSVCRDVDGTYYLPGVGYQVPADAEALAVARNWRAASSDAEIESDCP